MADLDSASEITVSGTKVGSSLAAALANVDAIGLREFEVVVAAARKQLKLSRIPCEHCGGTGWINSNVLPYETQAESCPSCGGSGEGWAEELVELVAVAIGRYHQKDSYDYRKARGVLDALDLYLKEATT